MNGHNHPLWKYVAQTRLDAAHKEGVTTLQTSPLVLIFSDEEVQELFEHWLRNTTLPRPLPPR